MKRLLSICYIILYYIAALYAQTDSIAHVTHFSEADGYAQSIVSHAIQDRRGYVWLGTWNGLLRYDGYRFRTYKARPGDLCPLRINRIGTVREMEDGTLECTTTDSMTCRFHPQTERFEQINGNYNKRPRPYKADSVTVNKVKSLSQFRDGYTHILLVDRQGGIWVDTHSGLYRIWYSRRQLEPIKTTTANEQEVRCLHIDRQGRRWVADKNGFLRIGNEYLTPQGVLISRSVPLGLRVYCIFEDSRGDVWLGCKPGGLVRLSPSTRLSPPSSYTVTRYLHNENDPYSLSGDNVYAIAEDRQQRLWIATYRGKKGSTEQGGLNMLDLRSGRGVFLNSQSGLANWPTDTESNKIHCLFITNDQVLVVGTKNGLYTATLHEKPQQMHFYHNYRRADDATSLSNNWVKDLQPLPGGRLVVATAGGGICMTNQSLLTDNTRFCTLTADQGLASDVCESMCYNQRDSSLYVVSQTAISRLSMRDSTFNNYLRGTLSDNFNLLETKPVITANGSMLFGTTQGVLSFSPDDIQKSQYEPPIVFESSQLHTSPYTISLSPDERSITIRFAALDFNKRVPITYAFRIDGMTTQWTYITDPQLTLPDIPAGTYRLHIRSTNGDGIWTQNEQTLVIQRRAAFHETPYAWMLYGLLLTLFIIGSVLVIRYVRHMQHEIKDIRLTKQQRMSVMSERIQEQLSIRESIGPIDNTAEDIENEEDRLFAERIKQYVQDNLSNSSLSVVDIARGLAISRTVLFARMKRVFGTSPANYLQNQRIRLAQQLLHQPEANVADVAYRCGFSEPKYFSKCFKKIVGQTPTEYQKETTLQ